MVFVVCVKNVVVWFSRRRIIVIIGAKAFVLCFGGFGGCYFFRGVIYMFQNK